MIPTKLQFILYALKVFWHDNNDFIQKSLSSFRMLETVLAKHCILDNMI